MWKNANTLKHQDKLQVQLPRSACFLFSQGVGASLSWFSLWDWSPKFRSASTLADQKDKTASMWQAGKFHAVSGGRPVTPAISEGWQDGRRPPPQGQRHLGVRWLALRWWSSGIRLLLQTPCPPTHLFPSASPHWNYYRPGPSTALESMPHAFGEFMMLEASGALAIGEGVSLWQSSGRMSSMLELLGLHPHPTATPSWLIRWNLNVLAVETMTLRPPCAGALKSCLLTKAVLDGGSGRNDPTLSQLPCDPGFPVWVVKILPSQPAWPHVQWVDPTAHLVPPVSFLPGVHVRRGLCEPIAQVLPLGPWDTQLESTVGDEDPKGMPCQWVHQGPGDPLSDQSIFEPPESSIRCAWTGDQPIEVLVHRGDQKIHILELVKLGHLTNHRHHTQPPVLPSEAKLGANQRDWLFADLGRRYRLGLPCLEFQGVGGHVQVLGVHMLQVIEPGAASKLESGQGRDVSIHHGVLLPWGSLGQRHLQT